MTREARARTRARKSSVGDRRADNGSSRVATSAIGPCNLSSARVHAAPTIFCLLLFPLSSGPLTSTISIRDSNFARGFADFRMPSTRLGQSLTNRKGVRDAINGKLSFFFFFLTRNNVNFEKLRES